MNAIPHYDPLAPQMLEDPYPHYAKLQREHPIFWHEGMQSWVVTRYRDCLKVLRDHTTFSVDWNNTGVEVPPSRQNLQSMDPPTQTPLRSLLVTALRAQDFDLIAQRTREHLQRLFAGLSDRQSFNWMTEVASPVALSLTANLMGVEEPDHNTYKEISEGVALLMDSGLHPENAVPGGKARTRLNDLADQWFATPKSTGLLKEVKENSAKAQVPLHFLRNSVGMMFNASYGTVFATAGNAVLTLLRHPEAMQVLRDQRLLTTAVDEIVRFDGPAQGTSRVAIRTIQLHDATIKPGQVVMTALAAANRDPEEFANPHVLMLDRTPNRHLGFGWGTHACLGAAFGTIVVQEIIRSLLDAPRPLRLTGTPIRRHTATVRSIELLPVTFGDD